MTTPELLTVAQVAERLNISETHAYELVHGDLRHGALRIGRTIRVRADHLEKWIEKATGHIDPEIPYVARTSRRAG